MTKQLIAGLIIGLLAPFIFLLIMLSFFIAPDFSMSEILSGFWMNTSLSSAVSLAVIINLGWFFLLDKMNKEIMSRGIIAGTILWGFYIIMLIK